MNRHVYPPLMDSGAVRGFVAGGYWNDLGAPARYLSAQEDLLAGRIPLARFRGADPRDGLLQPAPGAFVSPTAVVEAGAELVAPALVGPGCHVASGARVGPFATLAAGARLLAGARVARGAVWADTTLGPGEVLEGAIAAGEDRVRG